VQQQMDGRRTLRRLGPLAAACAALVVLATAAGATAAHRDTTTLTIWCWTPTDDALKSADAGFERAHPGIELKYVQIKPADVYQKLQLAAAAGSGFPDVSCIEDSHLAQFTKLGILADLTKQAAPYRKQIQAYKWTQQTLDGRVYAFPWDAGPMALFYRRSVFKKAHISPASIHTWNDFYKAGQKLKKLGIPIWLQSKAQNDARFFEDLLWQQGLGYVNGKGDVILDKNKRILSTLEFMGKMWNAGMLGDLAEWTDPWYKAISGGQVATLPMAVWMGTFLKSWLAPKTAGDWGVVPLPSWTATGAHTANDGGSSLAIMKTSDAAAAAWQYVQWHLGRADVQSHVYQQTDLFPSLESAWRSPYMRQADPYYGGQKTRLVFEKLAKQIPVAHVYSSDYEQMDTLMTAELQKYALGKESAQAALKNAANAIRSRTGRS
jgi:ABC-type glycerol-3-phosphate transport system substrate-binding protein